MHKKKNKGFTLLELIVVVAIIAILSAIVLAALGYARSSGRDGRRISDVHQIQNALELYFSTNKTYPPNLAALVPSSMVSIPVDPANTGAFVYWYTPLGTTTTCSGYHLAASLENYNNVLKTDSDVNSAGLTRPNTCGVNPTVPWGANGGNGTIATPGTSESTFACDGASSGYCYDLMK